MNYTPAQEELWNKVVENLRNNYASYRFNTWIKPMTLYAITANEVIVTLKNAAAQTMIVARYQSEVEVVVRNVFGMRYSFRIMDEKDIPRGSQLDDKNMLNAKYTFENFVVGSSNELAFGAALAVAEMPAQCYNPLFLYGDVGLGKTHLMNAIGNYIVQENPMSRVLLTTSERIATELIDAIIKKRGNSEMRDRLRNVDVLMVDDIQFLGKTTTTQEEFFHTFNELTNNGKQIVISSDRPPNELPAIEERLRSRFGSGLTIQIAPPDFETRVAILMRKAEADGVDLPYEVAEYIAAHFDKSIRELEGALTNVTGKSRVLGLPISLEVAQSALDNLVQTTDTRVVTAKLVMEVVAKNEGVTVEDLLGKKRNKEITEPRQIAIYICRELTELSTTTIGKEFGRDHTTVMHSCEKVGKQMESDHSFRKKVTDLIGKVKNA